MKQASAKRKDIMGDRTYRSTVRRPTVTELVELARDLDATWPQHDSTSAQHAWMGRPAILRRVADELARRLPRPCDRVVVHGPHAAVLGAAVGLASGIEWSLAGDAAAVDGEHRAIAAIHADDLPEANDDAARLAIVGARPGVDSLFHAVGSRLEVAA